MMNLDPSTFEQIVSAHYESLYRFALSLARNEADAADLTQEVFRRLWEKVAQVRDASKVKTWLFTTLYREFVDARNHNARLEPMEEEALERDHPVAPPAFSERLDGALARDTLLA